MKKFDVFVIGTGTAGETALAELIGKGLKLGAADELPYGGTCALRGCQPKKFLVVPSHAALEGRALTERGFAEAPVLDWKIMRRSMEEFTGPVPESVQRQLTEQGVECFNGHCEFLSPRELRCGEETIQSDYFIIASGARPRPLPFPGGELAGSSDDFLSLREIPENIVFIGGGYVSMEFAYVAAAAGAKVTVIQRGGRIMERFDPYVVSILENACVTRGMDIRTEENPSAIEKRSSGQYRVCLESGDEIETECVIGAVGRVPNIENLGLEAAGVECTKRGITTDEYSRTSRENIFAAGDCAEGIQLSPLADMEARTAARNILVPESEKSDYSTVPSVVFTYPQLASVGMDERTAGEKIDAAVYKGSCAGWPNYRRLNESHAGYKIIVDKKHNTVAGAHLAGPYAGELINLFALAIRQNIPVRQLKELPWAYPTYAADIKYMFG